MDDTVQTSPYATADRRLQDRIISDAESMLNAQLTAALAADQRALVFAGFLSTAVVGLMTGLAALLTATRPDIGLAVVDMAVIVALLVATASAIYSARPTSFWFVGLEPANWLDDIKSCRTADDCLADLAEMLDRRIKQNSELMQRNGKLMARAVWLAFASIVLGSMLFIGILLGRIG